MTGSRWDTREHRHNDPRRLRPGGKPYMPWHDATMVVDGEAARALAELSRDRWKTATGRDLPTITGRAECWPEGLEPDFRDVDVAIARTRAPYNDVEEVREIESLWLDIIGRTERLLYIENQYFTSPKIAAAFMERLREDDPPEFVLIMPVSADGWLEKRAMDGARQRLLHAIKAADTHDRFRIYSAKTTGGDDIYIHAKVSIMDDTLLRVGSANMNNRSMGLDSECDVAIDAGLETNAGAVERIAAIRADLIAEHLAVDADTVIARFGETGSLIETIETLRGEGKTLVPLALEEVEGVEAFIADHELLDPETPSEMFALPKKRQLFGRLRKRLRARRRR